MLVLWIGVPRATSVVGMVERGSPAAEVGLAPGDRLLSVDGEAVSWWREVREAIAESTNPSVRLELERRIAGGEGSERLVFDVPIERRGTLDPFGAVVQEGWIGLGSRRLPALLGVPVNDSSGALAGLHSGDRVTRVGDVDVEDWEALRSAYSAVEGETVRFELLRPEEGVEETDPITIDVPVLASLGDLGVISATILASVVSPGMPAEEAGLERGDLLLAVDGRPVGSFESFANTVRTSGGRALAITYAREGKTTTVSIQPRLQQVEGPLEIEGMTEDIYQIGIGHALAALPGVSALDRVRNPLESLPRAVAMTTDMTLVFLKGLGKLASGEMSRDKLAGPIGIAEIARKSLDLGWEAYLSTMVLISINLGIINLLPIPILDGGQALIYLVEGVKRSPISLRSREIVQQTGLIMIVLLMGLAFWNDLSRHWAQFVEWISTAL
jgi:regulator of sigma E protease